MKFRRQLLFCLFVSFAPMIASAQNLSYNDAMERFAQSAQSNINPGEIAAIVNFESSARQFSDRVIEDLTNELIKSQTRLVERQNMEYILAEQQFQLSGYVSDDSMVSIGKMLGADCVIIGKGENMTDYYRITFRMLSVETSEIRMLSSLNVRYSNEMRRLLDGQASASSGIGTTRFAIGARAGAGFQINTADKDMVGEGYLTKDKSNIAFAATLFGAFKFNDAWSIQPEAVFTFNNGMEISDQKYTTKMDYTTLDVPLLVRWNFIQRPIVAGIFAGPYISLPIGKLNISMGDAGASLDMEGYTFGATGGLAAGIRAGPGHFVGDVRFLHDFSSFTVNEDFGDDITETEICVRRSINLSIGYEFSL